MGASSVKSSTEDFLRMFLLQVFYCNHFNASIKTLRTKLLT